MAQARNDEEDEVTQVLAELERLDPTSAQFEQMLSDFEHSVTSHAESEECDEFPLILSDCDKSQRPTMRRLQMVEKTAPTPHTRPRPDQQRRKLRLGCSPRWSITRGTR